MEVGVLDGFGVPGIDGPFLKPLLDGFEVVGVIVWWETACRDGVLLEGLDWWGLHGVR